MIHFTVMNEAELTALLHEAASAKANAQYEQATKAYETLLNQSQPTKDPTIQLLRFTAWRELGDLLRLLGKQEEAITNYQHYCDEAHGTPHYIEALYLLGLQHGRLGHHQKGLDAQRQALQYAKNTNDTSGRAKAYAGIGNALAGLGQLEEAVQNIQTALGLFQQLNNGPELARTWNALGLAQVRLGKTDKAIIAFVNALEKARLHMGKREVCITLTNLGECYQSLYNMEKALQSHEEALNLVQELNLPSAQADILRNFGVDLFYLNRPEEAHNYLQQALEMSQKAGLLEVYIQALYSIAYAEVSQGSVEQARTHGQAMKELAESNNSSAYLAESLYILGLCHQKENEFPAAEQLWQQASFLAHETKQRSLLWRLHAALAQIAPSISLATAHNRIAAEIIDQIVWPLEDETLRNTFLNTPIIQTIRQAAKG